MPFLDDSWFFVCPKNSDKTRLISAYTSCILNRVHESQIQRRNYQELELSACKKISLSRFLKSPKVEMTKLNNKKADLFLASWISNAETGSKIYLTDNCPFRSHWKQSSIKNVLRVQKLRQRQNSKCRASCISSSHAYGRDALIFRQNIRHDNLLENRINLNAWDLLKKRCIFDNYILKNIIQYNTPLLLRKRIIQRGCKAWFFNNVKRSFGRFVAYAQRLNYLKYAPQRTKNQSALLS